MTIANKIEELLARIEKQELVDALYINEPAKIITLNISNLREGLLLSCIVKVNGTSYSYGEIPVRIEENNERSAHLGHILSSEFNTLFTKAKSIYDKLQDKEQKRLENVFYNL